ncbi:MAG TPA: hypothetical protein VFG07_02175 [Thermoplasmata archaeon]|nr:hypothetical protein [Thermoplasmata archaeon]
MAPKEGPADETGARRRRAVEEPLDYVAQETSPIVVLRVRNPLHGTQYQIYLPAYPSRDWALCTCPDFARRGLGTCKHLEGTGRWIAEHPVLEPRPRPPSPDVGARWAEIDRRRAVLNAATADGPALRSIGAALFDRLRDKSFG